MIAYSFVKKPSFVLALIIVLSVSSCRSKLQLLGGANSKKPQDGAIDNATSPEELAGEVTGNDDTTTETNDDPSKNENTTTTSAGTAPVATITGAPVGTVTDLQLDITIAGSGVTGYRYLVAVDAGNCNGTFGAETPVATKIADSLASFADGPLRLCVIGRNAAGTWQATAAATAATWTKTTAVVPASPPSGALAVPGNKLITLRWQSGGSQAGFVVVRKIGSVVNFSPVNGTTYNVNDSVLGNEIVSIGSEEFFVDTGLVNGTTYHYAVFSYASDYTYHGGLAPDTTASAIPGTPVSAFSRLGVGMHSSCGVSGSGTAYCWGDDGFDQLGNGAGTTDVDKPAPVSIGLLPLSTAFTDVQAGNNVSCGLTSEGIIYCWGSESNHGFLGNGGVLNDVSPTPVALDLVTSMPDGANTRWRQLSVGKYYACAITSKGEPACWGRNGNGCLGVGDEVNRGSPTPVVLTNVTGSKKFKSIAVYTANTCGTTTEGDTYCWGTDFNDLLGDGAGAPSMCGGGTIPCAMIPTAISTGQLAGEEKALHLATGERHSCLSTSLGKMFCWADDDAGNQGDGLPLATQNSAPNPIDLTTVTSGSTKIRSVSTGRNHSCFVTDGGVPYCFGDEAYGKIASDYTSTTTQAMPSPNPMYLADLTGERSVRTVSLGLDHGCMIDGPGKTYCFGRDDEAQLGNGIINTPQGRPDLVDMVNVDSAPKFTQLAALALSTCGITQYGELFCWGSNTHGQLGNGTNNLTTAPASISLRSIPSDKSFMAVAGGDLHACALTYSGDVHCFGSDAYGQLGDGNAVRDLCPANVQCGLEPAPIATGTLSANTKFKKITSGADHSCALSGSGIIYCWGNDSNGQLGNGGGVGDKSNIPTAVDTTALGAVSFIDVAGGQDHTCGLTAVGTVFCWGRDDSGQLGNGAGETAIKDTPFAVDQTVSGPFLKIAARGDETCALAGNGSIYCWGSDSYGQIGDGATVSLCGAKPCSQAPSMVSGGDVYMDLAVGMQSACAVGADGFTKCWGNQTNGRLGNGLAAGSVDAPVAVLQAGLSSIVKSFKSLALGNLHACAIAGDGLAYCWGAGTSGQIGNGLTIDSDVPKIVSDP